MERTVRISFWMTAAVGYMIGGRSYLSAPIAVVGYRAESPYSYVEGDSRKIGGWMQPPRADDLLRLMEAEREP
jgi:hypothetical protein